MFFSFSAAAKAAGAEGLLPPQFDQRMPPGNSATRSRGGSQPCSRNHSCKLTAGIYLPGSMWVETHSPC
jgi:hypothetical protein